MSSPYATDSTVHLLSKKSRRLHRDTFFFLPYLEGNLLGGELALNWTFCHVYRSRLCRPQGLTNVSPQ